MANTMKKSEDTGRINRLTRELEMIIMDKIIYSPIEMEIYIRMITDAIKAVCTETLLWIHFKNVRYMNSKLLEL